MGTSKPLKVEGLPVADESHPIAEEGYSVSGIGASQLAAWLHRGGFYRSLKHRQEWEEWKEEQKKGIESCIWKWRRLQPPPSLSSSSRFAFMRSEAHSRPRPYWRSGSFKGAPPGAAVSKDPNEAAALMARRWIPMFLTPTPPRPLTHSTTHPVSCLYLLQRQPLMPPSFFPPCQSNNPSNSPESFLWTQQSDRWEILQLMCFTVPLRQNCVWFHRSELNPRVGRWGEQHKRPYLTPKKMLRELKEEPEGGRGF